MTAAEEKVKELVNKFIRTYKVTLFPPFNTAREEAKSSALICIENEYKSLREMLFNLKSCKVIESDSVYLGHIQNLIDEENEIKAEIEKL